MINAITGLALTHCLTLEKKVFWDEKKRNYLFILLHRLTSKTFFSLWLRCRFLKAIHSVLARLSKCNISAWECFFFFRRNLLKSSSEVSKQCGWGYYLQGNHWGPPVVHFKKQDAGALVRPFHNMPMWQGQDVVLSLRLKQLKIKQ